MSETKQTAVDYFSEETFNQFNLFQQGYISISEFRNRMITIENTAKEMEKEQIIDAYNNGENRSAELYYNETYGDSK